MNLTSIKKLPEIPGVTFEIDREGASVRRIHVRHPGGYFLIAHRDFGGLELFSEAPPKTKKVWLVTGQSFVGGKSVDISETFETQAQADRFASALDDGAVTKEAEILAEDLEAA